jgi:GT2 family glycosyltransferase
VIVDSNPSLKAELAAVLPGSVRLLETERPGLSEARNVGIRAATSDVVAFVDDDAAGEPQWLSSLMDALEADDQVLGVGGPVVPDWGAERRWLRDELLWIVGCTYRGHREDAGPIRNPIGCNMAFRRRELIDVGSFATGFGKRGNALETCDETELSLRLALAHGPGRIRYEPAARVRHFVPASRISWRLLVRLGPERSYARGLVVEAVPRLLLAGIRRRDGRFVMGAAAILLSLLITGGAFVAGAFKEGRRQARLSAGSERDEVGRDAKH